MYVSQTNSLPFSYYIIEMDAVLPIDNLLKPRRRYAGDDLHKIALQQQHKSFLLVHKRLRKEKKRQAKYADQKSKDQQFQIGDPVYYKNHRKISKLQNNWKPYYRIIDQITPVTFIIKHQLDGVTYSFSPPGKMSIY
jgi:hypothetical protein